MKEGEKMGFFDDFFMMNLFAKKELNLIWE